MSLLDSTARNKLPDSSFAYIDSQGGRHLPIHDAAHTRAALSRLSQTHFESATARSHALSRVHAAAGRFGITMGDEDDKAEGELAGTASGQLSGKGSMLLKAGWARAAKAAQVGADGNVIYGFARINKYDPTTGETYGRVSSDDLDLDGQIADKGWLDQALPEWFANWGNMRQMHQPIAAGKALELIEAGNGYDLYSRAYNPETKMLLSAKVLQGYSIGIKDPVVIPDPHAPNGRIVGGKIVETSYVDYPANPTAKITLVKAVGNRVEFAVGELEERSPSVAQSKKSASSFADRFTNALPPPKEEKDMDMAAEPEDDSLPRSGDGMAKDEDMAAEPDDDMDKDADMEADPEDEYDNLPKVEAPAGHPDGCMCADCMASRNGAKAVAIAKRAAAAGAGAGAAQSKLLTKAADDGGKAEYEGAGTKGGSTVNDFENTVRTPNPGTPAKSPLTADRDIESLLSDIKSLLESLAPKGDDKDGDIDFPNNATGHGKETPGTAMDGHATPSSEISSWSGSSLLSSKAVQSAVRAALRAELGIPVVKGVQPTSIKSAIEGIAKTAARAVEERVDTRLKGVEGMAAAYRGVTSEASKTFAGNTGGSGPTMDEYAIAETLKGLPEKDRFAVATELFKAARAAR